MSDRTCTVPGCDRPLLCRGWCTGHYNRWKKTGGPGTTPIAPRHPQNPGATCSIAGCARPGAARGMCDTHSVRVKIHGSPLADSPIRPDVKWRGPAPCAVEGCGRARTDREWCGTHYKRWTVHGDPLVNRSRVRRPCSINDCDRLTEARGLCKTHSDRLKRSGDPAAHVPIDPLGRKAPVACRAPGCTAVACARGHCRRHYQPIFKREIEADPVRLAARKANSARLHRAWVAANPERAAAAGRLWRFNNPGKRRASDRRRYERLKAAPHIPFSYEQLMARMRYWGEKCWVCGGSFEAIDHVKPINKGGYHALMNFRPICTFDNSSKKDKWPFVPTQRAPI